jgi:hypothetical protein
MTKHDGDPEMPRMTEALPLTTEPPRQVPRGWVILGLALAVWLVVLITGYAMWNLLT